MRSLQSVGQTKITPAIIFRVLMVLVWVQNTVLVYAIQIFRMLPVIGQAYKWVSPALIMLFVLLSLAHFNKKIQPQDLVFYLVCLSVLFATMIFLPKNAEYLKDELFTIITNVIPVFFLGLGYCHEESERDLYYASLIGVGAVAFYQLYSLASGGVLHTDNMDASYKVLPSVLYLIYWASEHKSLKNWLIAGLSMFLVFVFGTRGPILVCACYLTLAVYIAYLSRKAPRVRITLTIVLTVTLLILFNNAWLLSLLETTSEMFGKIGFSTRIFDYILAEKFGDSGGRDRLHQTIIEAIWAQPFLGYGIMGDRVFLDNYVHNLALELWCAFGIFVGTSLLIAYFGTVFLALKRSKATHKYNFLLMLLCLEVIKLMLSGSFLHEQMFFFLLGYAIRINREARK